MPIDIVSQSMMVPEKCEQITLMDDYGAQFHLYIPVSTAAADRATQIQNAIAGMQANQTAMEAVAIANGYDINGQKTAGIARKTAMIAAMPAAMATVAKAAVATAVTAVAVANVPAASAVGSVAAPLPATPTST
jgi:hypothetical protein